MVQNVEGRKEMLEFLLAPQNVPFAAAWAVLALVLVLQLVGAIFGLNLGEALEGGDADLNLDLDGAQGAGFLGIIGLGRIPLLIWLAVVCFGVGAVGYILQFSLRTMGWPLLPWWLALIPALIVGLAVARAVSGPIGRLFKRDDSTAVAADSLVGQLATVTLGPVSAEKPGQAKVADQHGQTHYVIVQPRRAGDAFAVGDEVVLVLREGSRFSVMPHDWDLIADTMGDAPAERQL
jgi:hypothetical protein